MQRETLADRDAVTLDLEAADERRRHNHIIADSEKERTKEKKEEINERLDSARYRLGEWEWQLLWIKYYVINT